MCAAQLVLLSAGIAAPAEVLESIREFADFWLADPP